MGAIGGSILEISIHGRNFSVAADADINRRLSGTVNELQFNGNNTARIITTRGGWMLGGVQVAIDPDLEDEEFLRDIIERRAFGDVTISFADNSVYSGNGTLTGEVEYSSGSATATLTLSGPGSLTKQ